MSKCAKLKIIGLVQGVFFRDYAQEKASELKVAGWVRNASDGTVEAMLEGSSDSVDQMIAWCHQGSPGSQVEKVEIEWVAPEGCEGFEVRY
ncbi:acylphosphatase [Patescibacteria group bacterium]